MVDPRVHRWTTLGFVLLLAAVLAFSGYWLLFTTFMVYDDEGYVLISLRNYSQHGGLYDRVYTQYGPFLYVLYDGLSRLLGFTFNNTSGRWITLVNWFGTAVACSAFVGRATRSTIWAAATMAGTFLYLWIMVHEPVHPGGLIAVVVAVATWLGAEAWRTQRFVGFGIIAGLATAALALTKVNVGVFFAGAVGTWLALNSATPKSARLLTWIAAMVCAALPLALMRAMLDSQWVGVFALVFATGSLATVIIGRLVAQPVASMKVWLAFITTGAGVAVAICTVVVLRGTTLDGLFEGVVLGPLKHPGVYYFGVRWQTGSALIATASLVFAVIASQPRWSRSEPFKESIAWLRVILAGVFWCTSMGVAATSMSRWGMSYGVSLAWLFVLPLRSDTVAGPLRAWLGLMLVFQSLQAYPVAGSQLSWGTYLWIPLLALGIHDAAPLLGRRLHRWATLSRGFGYATVAAMTLFMVGNLAKIGWTRYTKSQQLGLPGAKDLRLPNDLTYALRTVNENLRAHAGVLFSFPGLYSANLWTDLRTPTLANATHWFSLLSAERQQAIIDELARDPRATILVERQLVDFLARNGFAAHGLLYDWITQNFEKTLAFASYEIWVHRGRTIAALSTVHVNRTNNGAVESLTLTLRSPEAAIQSIQVADIDSPQTSFVNIQGPGTAATITPCGPDGKSTGPARLAKFPLSFTGIAHVTLPFTALDKIPEWARPMLVLKDAKGAVLGELVMVQ